MDADVKDDDEVRCDEVQEFVAIDSDDSASIEGKFKLNRSEILSWFKSYVPINHMIVYHITTCHMTIYYETVYHMTVL